MSPNLPPRSVRMPHPRHRLLHVTQRTAAKEVNSVVEPWVDVATDVAAINRGGARRNGDTYTVNGRRYRLEESGRVYPIDGPGIHRLGRGAFKALGVYNQFGLSGQAEIILDEMAIQATEREAARIAWRAGRGRN